MTEGTKKRKDIIKSYSVTRQTYGSKRWCHTNYNALPPYEQYFVQGEDGVAYAIWAKMQAVYSGDSVLQAYVEFFEQQTLNELHVHFGGYWNEATYNKDHNKIYLYDLDVVTEDGPWEFDEVEHETETDTQFIAIEYDFEPSRVGLCDDPVTQTDDEDYGFVHWSSEVEDPYDSEQRAQLKKKLRGAGYFIDDEAEEST